jgi:hypothetical protein
MSSYVFFFHIYIYTLYVCHLYFWKYVSTVLSKLAHTHKYRNEIKEDIKINKSKPYKCV